MTNGHRAGEYQIFGRKKLPCDAFIYLGTGYIPSGWNTGHGSLNFNPTVFDKPAMSPLGRECGGMITPGT